MSAGDIKDWLSIATGLISIGTFLYVFLTRGGKEAGEKVSKLETKVDEKVTALEVKLNAAIAERDRKIDNVEDRIARLEGELKGIPDRDSVHKMQLEMVAVRGALDVLNERLVPLAAISGRLQEFLLEQAKGV